jgi:AraC family transcriptional regulator, regulatory protein of adaptative response / methylated-DNA-[protein]-cysteine methyltransferase
MFDFAAHYEALQRRDPALDGVLFVAVKTTGIYCRPVCRARTPFARNAPHLMRGGYRFSEKIMLQQ